jgi:uncharacterized iron-regulated protein
VLAGCAHELTLREHPLAGRIWDVRAAAFVSQPEVIGRAARTPHVILGETHDNPEHHRLQLAVLEALAPSGRRTLVMEQFDSEHQAALDAAPAGPEALADAGKLDRKGWNWPLYEPLVRFAVRQGWRIGAGNLSRVEARAIVAEPGRSGLPPAEPSLLAALEHDMIAGHCGMRPEPKRLAGLVEAQRARDARLAAAMAEPSVLITGSTHARRDRGVPLYLRGGNVLSIAFLEVEAGANAPQDYPQGFDYVWFTLRSVRDDLCNLLRK